MTALAPTLQAFFTERLVRQRHAGPGTIRAYRDTWRLLLRFASERNAKPPTLLDIEDIDAELVAAFLHHLEHGRGNTIRTRNARLAAIHSLFAFAAPRHPEHAETIGRVLAIPSKRFERVIVDYLTENEVDVLLAAPDPRTRTGRRDRALMLLAVQTGLRITELVELRRGDIHLGAAAHVACRGKGRKNRITPLTVPTIEILRDWLAEREGGPADPVFPNRTGQPLSRDAVERRLAQHHATASRACPSLSEKRLTAHVLRHIVPA